MKHTLDELHEYATMWYDQERWTDLNMALDSGYTDLALRLLMDSGAIDSTNCYEDAQSIEKAIEKRMKKYNRKMYDKDSNKCFKNAIVYVHPNSNEHAFIKNKDVDYLMSHDDMIKMGYITSDEYYNYDLTLYCNACKAKSAKKCKCGPIAEND